jgi:hypothetical protein
LSGEGVPSAPLLDASATSSGASHDVTDLEAETLALRKEPSADLHDEGGHSHSSALPSADSHDEGGHSHSSAADLHDEGGNSLSSAAYLHDEGGNSLSSAAYLHDEGGNSLSSAVDLHDEGGNSLSSATLFAAAVPTSLTLCPYCSSSFICDNCLDLQDFNNNIFADLQLRLDNMMSSNEKLLKQQEIDREREREREKERETERDEFDRTLEVHKWDIIELKLKISQLQSQNSKMTFARKVIG